MPENLIFTTFEYCAVRGDWESILPGPGLSAIVKKSKDPKNCIINVVPINDSNLYFCFQEGAKISISGNVLTYTENDATGISFDEYTKRHS